MNEAPEGYHACSSKDATLMACTSRDGMVSECQYYCEDSMLEASIVIVYIVIIIFFGYWWYQMWKEYR